MIENGWQPTNYISGVKYSLSLWPKSEKKKKGKFSKNEKKTTETSSTLMIVKRMKNAVYFLMNVK